MQTNEITYSIEVSDVQRVAQETLGRTLSNDELSSLQNALGDYFDWYQTIAQAVQGIAESDN